MSGRSIGDSRASWKTLALGGLLGGVVLSSCAAAPFMIPSILEFGRNLLITTNSNYGNKYREDMNQLLMSVSRSWVNTPYPPRYAAAYPGQPGMPGPMPGQPMPGQSMPGQPGMPGMVDPNNPYAQQQLGQPMPGQSMPGYPGGSTPAPGYPGAGGQTPAYPGTTMPGYPSQPVPPYPTQSFPQPGYPAAGSQYPGGQPGMAYPSAPMQQYPDPNNPYGQYPGGMPQGQQNYPSYPPSGPSNNPYQGGATPYPPAGGGQAYPGGVVSGGYPQMSGGMPPGMQGYPAGAPGQQAYGSNPMMGGGAPSPGYPGAQPGMPQAAYPQMPQQGNPYGGMPQMGQPPMQPGYPPGAPPGYGGMPQGVPQQGGYPGMPYQTLMPRGIGPIVGPLEVDVALLRQITTSTGKQVALMQDGETLKDGRGNVQLGDKFKIVFRTNADCFMYVIAIDGSGWAQPLLPGPGVSIGNPITKDKEYTFPEGSQWFSLDQVRGIETIYLIASPGPRPDIEEALTKITGVERPAVTPVAQVQEAAILPAGFGSTAAGHPTPVKLETGQQTEITPTTYRAAQPGEDVRVTRWFKHE